LIASLNLTPATAMLTSATTSALNAIASPSTTDDSYNVSHAIPVFTKYLEETRINLIKRITQPKYDDLVSWLVDPNCIARS
jgi:hypothetical protein